MSNSSASTMVDFPLDRATDRGPAALANNTAPPMAPETEGIGIYECELTLRFRLIEDQQAIANREDLLDLLLEAFCQGQYNYVEAIDSQVSAQPAHEADASARLRRQLIKLRNTQILAS
ncbi:MAG: Npun_R1517 family heterocyst differentiation transcriptional regulator [Cyanobacteria bacterium P01_H01_bin.121]